MLLFDNEYWVVVICICLMYGVTLYQPMLHYLENLNRLLSVYFLTLARDER